MPTVISETAFLRAASEGHTAIVEYLAGQGADIQRTSVVGGFRLDHSNYL